MYDLKYYRAESDYILINNYELILAVTNKNKFKAVTYSNEKKIASHFFVGIQGRDFLKTDFI